MSFLNGSLVFGIVAAAIPVVLHLISRREPKRMVFPAVRFLSERAETNRSRVKIRRWVLLALRAGLLAILALALAQPQILQEASTDWLTLGICGVAGLVLVGVGFIAWVRKLGRGLTFGTLLVGLALVLFSILWSATSISKKTGVLEKRTSAAAIAIVIDNSPRSDYVESDGSRLAKMQDFAKWLVGRYSTDSRVAILDRSERPGAFSLDGASAIRTVQKLKPIQRVRPLSERIEVAVRLVRTSALQRRTVFVLSDLTAASWTPMEGPDSAASLPPLLNEDPKVTVQVVDFGEPDDRNRWLGNVHIADPTPQLESAVPIEFTVHAAEAIESTTLNVELQLFEPSAGRPVVRDGKTVFPESRPVDRTSVDVRGGSPSKQMVSLPPLSFGTHHARIALSGSDPLAVDDVRYLTVTVLPPTKILLVSENERSAKVLGECLVAPYKAGNPRAEFQIRTIPFAQLTEAAFTDVETIGLLDPPRLSDATSRLLRQWVVEGGRLIVALGPSLSESTDVTSSVETPSLADPGRSAASESKKEATEKGDLFGEPRRIWRPHDPGTYLEYVRPSHPSISRLASLPGGVPWNRFPVHLYWQIKPEPGSLVLARYAGTEHPMLLERLIERGNVLILTTPIPALADSARKWNELFSNDDAWPAFLLVRNLFEYVGGRDAGTLNVKVGNSVTLSLSNDYEKTVPSSSRLQMFSHDIPPVPVPLNGTTVVPGVVSKAGNYWLRGSEIRTGFSANLPSSMTDLTRIGEDVLNDVLGSENYRLVHDREGVEATEQQYSGEVPLYSQAMLLVLILFVLEQVLSNRFYVFSRSPISGFEKRAGEVRP